MSIDGHAGQDARHVVDVGQHGGVGDQAGLLELLLLLGSAQALSLCQTAMPLRPSAGIQAG